MIMNASHILIPELGQGQWQGNIGESVKVFVDSGVTYLSKMKETAIRSYTSKPRSQRK